MDKRLLENSMQKLKEGKMEALDDIYNIIAKTVYLVSYSILRNKEHAEDMVHDTFIRILQNIHKYKLNTNAAAWILCMTRNLSLNEYVKKQRNISLEVFEGNITDDVNYPDKVLGTMYLKNVIDILDVDEREVMILFAINHFKHKEIAKIVNKPLGTVLWLYDKAKKKLQLKIKSDYNYNERNERAENKNLSISKEV